MKCYRKNAFMQISLLVVERDKLMTTLSDAGREQTTNRNSQAISRAADLNTDVFDFSEFQITLCLASNHHVANDLWIYGDINGCSYNKCAAFDTASATCKSLIISQMIATSLTILEIMSRRLRKKVVCLTSFLSFSSSSINMTQDPILRTVMPITKLK